MRPTGSVGEVRKALLQAARELARPHCAPTLQEMTAAAQVGRVTAMNTVKNMVRDGDLVIVRRRHVVHSCKPVAEYALPNAPEPVLRGPGQGSALLALAAAWRGRPAALTEQLMGISV